MIIRFVKDIPWKLKQIKFFFQRGFRGYSDSDVWDMNSYLVSILIPMLKQLRDDTYGYPAAQGIDLPEDWDKVLGKMILGFGAVRRLIERSNWEMNEGSKMIMKDSKIEFTHPWTQKQVSHFKGLDRKDYATFNEGMRLFHKFFMNLWD